MKSRRSAGIGATALALVAVAVCTAAAQGSRSAAILTLTVAANGPGQIAVSTQTADCRGTCKVSVLAGQKVTLTAEPDAGKYFTGWNGACVGSASRCEL